MEMSKTFKNIKAYAQRKGLPLIPIKAKDVIIIDKPNRFYESILEKVQLISKRLALSALYIGTGPREDALIKAICDRKNQNNCLEVHVILDANRATRHDSMQRSSVKSLEKLLLYDKVKLTLFKNFTNTTSQFNRLLSKFQKWNEISSTYHSKFLIFDDDVLITGANLSDIYFDKRQDRYVMINNSKHLGDYMYNFLDMINKKQQQERKLSSLNNITTAQESIKNSIYKYNKSYLESNNSIYNELEQDTDSFVIPLSQFGPAGITDKEDFLIFLDSILPDNGEVYLSSGYFNPSPTIEKLKLNRVIAPSESANGFFNGNGLLQYVPRLYTAISKRYLEKHLSCKYSIYNRPGWSYHAKGIWYEGLDDICIHVIGSSNFNYRSSYRDFETQLVILTKNKALMERLRNERISLWKDSYQIVWSNFEKLNIIYNSVAKILKSFL